MLSTSKFDRYVVAVFVATALAAGAGCGSTGPSTIHTTTSPQVTSIQPATVVGFSGPILLHFVGSNISSGVTVTVTTPLSETIRIPAASLVSPTPTSFDLQLNLNETGVYSFVLTNPNGDVSAVALLPVQATADSPVIESVAPNVPLSSQQLQTLLVQGLSFSDALTVRLIDPSGLIVGTAIVGIVQPTQFQLSATLNKKGTYLLSVTNPSGLTSNTLTVTVQ